MTGPYIYFQLCINNIKVGHDCGLVWPPKVWTLELVLNSSYLLVVVPLYSRCCCSQKHFNAQRLGSRYRVTHNKQKCTKNKSKFVIILFQILLFRPYIDRLLPIIFTHSIIYLFFFKLI